MFFPRIIESLPPLPRQHSADIGCTKITRQSEWLYTHIVLRALKVSYGAVGEGRVAVNCEKSTIFPEHHVYDPILDVLKAFD